MHHTCARAVRERFCAHMLVSARLRLTLTRAGRKFCICNSEYARSRCLSVCKHSSMLQMHTLRLIYCFLLPELAYLGFQRINIIYKKGDMINGLFMILPSSLRLRLPGLKLDGFDHVV
jgi:hypothetical protein